jgi:hypothetical protein
VGGPLVQQGATLSSEGTTTPTVTATVGTFTSVSATLKWQKVGNIYHVSGSVTITTAGTAAGQIKVPLPATPAAGSSFSAYEGQATGFVCGAFAPVADANIYIAKYDGATIIAGGRTIYFSGSFFV